MEDISFSLSVLPLFIGLIILFTISEFVRPEEGVEVLPHKEQPVSVSNPTWRAEPGVFPGHVLAAALVLCCRDNAAWGAQTPTAGLGAGALEHCHSREARVYSFPPTKVSGPSSTQNTFVELQYTLIITQRHMGSGQAGA